MGPSAHRHRPLLPRRDRLLLSPRDPSAQGIFPRVPRAAGRSLFQFDDRADLRPVPGLPEHPHVAVPHPPATDRALLDARHGLDPAVPEPVRVEAVRDQDRADRVRAEHVWRRQHRHDLVHPTLDLQPTHRPRHARSIPSQGRALPRSVSGPLVLRHSIPRRPHAGPLADAKRFRPRPAPHGRRVRLREPLQEPDEHLRGPRAPVAALQPRGHGRGPRQRLLAAPARRALRPRPAVAWRLDRPPVPRTRGAHRALGLPAPLREDTAGGLWQYHGGGGGDETSRGGMIVMLD